MCVKGFFMTKSELNLAEQFTLENFPKEINEDDLITYFTLSKADLKQVSIPTKNSNRLGLAIQLCALRFMGFFPKNLKDTPVQIVSFLATQIKIDTNSLRYYGDRENTKLMHQRLIIRHLKFKKFNKLLRKKLYRWLRDRAMEHERATFLVKSTCEKLLNEKIVRPGLTTIERMVSGAREKAWKKTYHILEPLIIKNKILIDNLLDSNDTDKIYDWLKSSAVINSSNAIIQTLDRIEFLITEEIDKWDLSGINANRLKFLFECGRQSTRSQLRRLYAKKKYSIAIVLLKMTLEKSIDEVLEQFDRNISGKDSVAKHKLNNFKKDISKATNEKLWLFKQTGQIILNSKIKDSNVRKNIYQTIPKEDFKNAIEDCDKIIRPKDDNYIDFFSNSFSDIRKYSPRFLNLLRFKSNFSNNNILKNIEFIKEYNIQKDLALLEDVPIETIPLRWRPYIFTEKKKINFRYYEIYTLLELKEAINSGDIWVENSNNFANPKSYLIPEKQWPVLLPEFLKMVGLSSDFSDRIEKKKKELEGLFPIVNDMLTQNNKIGEVRIENDELIVPRYLAEDSDRSKTFEDLLANSLPRVDLAEILLEVDSWVNFSQHFTHLAGDESRGAEITTNIYAAIISLACNIGNSQMEQASSILRKSLIWVTKWYLREGTLRPAIADIINYHHKHPLSSYWGAGTFSSSDGKRLTALLKSRTTTKNPKYCGFTKGIITNHTWTSDQCSQYGTKIAPSTKRDATYTLDEILNNITDLEISEHTTDTAGYTDIVFALFDLCGISFCPRLKDLGSQKLYRFEKVPEKYKYVSSLLRGVANEKYILKHSDEMLRIAGSIKLGWVPASLLIRKIQSSKGINNCAGPLKQYGCISKTIHILKYISNEKYQRRIGKQLNKGESIHTLEQFIYFCNESKIRIAEPKDQQLQAYCINLVTNAVILWNTVYMWKAIEHLKSSGYNISDDDISKVSPCRHEHINRLGKMSFKNVKLTGLRPLRPFK